MTQIAIRTDSVPLTLDLGPSPRWSDDELFELCARNPELRLERTPAGDLIVMTPAGWESSRRNLEIILALGSWAKRDGSGLATDSSAGFRLPNGAIRSPDAAWVRQARVSGLSAEERSRFLPLCPDFVVELRSPSDDLDELRAKMEEYRDNGVQLGWLVDPEERRVHVYRPGRQVEVLDQPSDIHGDPELPGFVLQLAPVWAAL